MAREIKEWLSIKNLIHQISYVRGMFNPKRFFRSFKFAAKGLKIVFREEQSFRVQVTALFIVLSLGVFFGIKSWEWTALILVAASVLVLELINSTLERIIDYLKPRLHYYVETVKDIMAAAVLVASVAALAVGILIFYPYFLRL